MHSRKARTYVTGGYEYRDHEFKLKPIRELGEDREVLVLEAFREDTSRFFLFETCDIPRTQTITIPIDSRNVHFAKYRDVLAKEITESNLKDRFSRWQRIADDVGKLERHIAELKSELPSPAHKKKR